MQTLKRFLDAHGITRESFDQAVAKDTAFFDKWIEPGATEEEITIAPRAVDRLEEILAEEGLTRQTEKNEEKGSKDMGDNIIQVNENPSIDGSVKTGIVSDTEPVATEPIESAARSGEKPSKKKEDSKPRRKRSKNTMTRDFIADHGQADIGDIKSLRSFLISAGLQKSDDVALMSDAEVQEIYKKEYFVISTANETYIFPRTLLNSIKNEVYVVEHNAAE